MTAARARAAPLLASPTRAARRRWLSLFGAHDRYNGFADFGDAAGYGATAEALREALRGGR